MRGENKTLHRTLIALRSISASKLNRYAGQDLLEKCYCRFTCNYRLNITGVFNSFNKRSGIKIEFSRLLEIFVIPDCD